MDCLCPKTVGKKEEKEDWKTERKNVRMCNAR